MSRWFFRAACAALLGCAPEGGDSSDAGTFVAFPCDFASFASWTSFDLGDGADGGGDDAACVHTADVPRTAFLNQAPPHGSTEFPVGTIIVKDIHAPIPQVLAMVKRGGGYGAGSGCTGWEWFGLGDGGTPMCSTSIEWRGESPPVGVSYASCGACSSCHSAASTNDCVLAPQMSLSQW